MKALIVRHSSIGDVVHTLPVLAALKREGFATSWIVEPAALPARIGARSHGGIIEGGVRHYLQRVMKATESYHSGMPERLRNGEDSKKISLETAKWVYTFTNLQPFELIHGMTRLMMKRSQAVADKEDLFLIP